MSYENELHSLQPHHKKNIDNLFNLGWASIAKYDIFENEQELIDLTRRIANEESPLFIRDKIFTNLASLASHIYQAINAKNENLD